MMMPSPRPSSRTQQSLRLSRKRPQRVEKISFKLIWGLVYSLALLAGFWTHSLSSSLSMDDALQRNPRELQAKTRNDFASREEPLEKNNTSVAHDTRYSSDANNIIFSKSTPSIYCFIPYVWTPRSRQRRIEILETWGPRCSQLQFLIDPIVETDNHTFEDARLYPPGSLPADVHIISNMTRSWHECEQGKECRHIWEKVWNCILWIHKHQPNYEWYVKTDWDTFLFPDNIRHFVHNVQNWSGYSEHHYTGHLDLHQIDNPFISGAAQIFSQYTIRALAKTIQEMPQTPEEVAQSDEDCADGPGLADARTALCLSKTGVAPQHSRDEHGRERVLLMPPNFMVDYNRTQQGEWWYWKNKPQTVGQMRDCCAHRPMAFHGREYKARIGEFYRIEQEVYGHSKNPEAAAESRIRWTEAANDYFAKVRQAMFPSSESQRTTKNVN